MRNVLNCDFALVRGTSTGGALCGQVTFPIGTIALEELANVQSNIVHPMRLTVGVDQARRLIEGIPHDTCRRAAERHWNVADDATVPEESVNWLFCWGKTGMGSRSAAEKAQSVFDAILPVAFSRYDDLVDHEYARTHRYAAEYHSAPHR